MDAIEYFDYFMERGIAPVPCQCCGFPTAGFGDICDCCGWEQDISGLQPNEQSASNGQLTLNQYREKYRDIISKRNLYDGEVQGK